MVIRYGNPVDLDEESFEALFHDALMEGKNEEYSAATNVLDYENGDEQIQPIDYSMKKFASNVIVVHGNTQENLNSPVDQSQEVQQ